MEDTLDGALAEARARHHECATPEHLLLALAQDPHARRMMEAKGVDLRGLTGALRRYLDHELEALKVAGAADPIPTAGFRRVLQRAALPVRGSGRDEMNGADVLVALFSEQESYAVHFLHQQDMSRLDAVTYCGIAGEKDAAARAPAAAMEAPSRPPGRRRKVRLFVSYAWGDNFSDIGRKRDAIVEKICESARDRGIDIRRDKTSLKPGDSISAFMRKIGRGDRIFVILSRKYLESAFCMFELSEIWRNARQDGSAFLSKVRIFALEDANICKPKDWVGWAVHWKGEHDELDRLARRHGASMLGTIGHRRLVQMQQFYTHIPDILGAMSDVVIPRTIEELERYGLDDLVE